MSESDYPSHNAVNVQLAATTWAVKLDFQERFPDVPGEKGKPFPPDVAVTISWPLAVALHAMLGEAIALYEKQEEIKAALPKSFRTARAAEK